MYKFCSIIIVALASLMTQLTFATNQEASHLKNELAKIHQEHETLKERAKESYKRPPYERRVVEFELAINDLEIQIEQLERKIKELKQKNTNPGVSLFNNPNAKEHRTNPGAGSLTKGDLAQLEAHVAKIKQNMEKLRQEAIERKRQQIERRQGENR